MMAERINHKKSCDTMSIHRVQNGYIVQRNEDLDEPVETDSYLGMLVRNTETRQYIFTNLADAVTFIGEHYQEPTRGIE